MQSAIGLPKCLRDRSNENLTVYTNELHENLLLKRSYVLEKLAFQIWKKDNSSVQVNGCVDHTAVAEKFAVHFTKAYSCNNANCADELDK